MYKAAFEKKLDVISGYSTDGRLKTYDLLTLEDDRRIFPPYYAAPVIRKEVLDKYKDLGPVLNKLSGHINDSVMTELNYRVEHLGQTPERCARDFLVKEGLYRDPASAVEGTIRLGSKIFPEQYILINMYAMLIRGYTGLKVDTKTGLGGTKICFEALINDRIDMYPEYTGTALLAILQPPADTVRQLGGDRDSVYDFVKKSFDEKYRLSWLDPIGFNNAYALMMRRSQAQQLGIHTITDLTTYLQKSKL
jgi:osmoprotectant transport system permease protein